MSFTNTVTSVGDEKLTDSIIDKSIIEFLDDVVTVVGDYALYECDALTRARFPNATSIGDRALYSCGALVEARLEGAVEIKSRAFGSCSELRNVDLNVATNIGDSAFSSCSKLETLIIRTPDQVCTITSNAFYNSGIASGIGYVYVPAALVDSYKTAANWSTYASQIRAIEDYPLVCGYKGKIWTRSNITSDGFYTVAYVDDLWVAGSYSKGLYYSTDGKTWTQSNITSNNFYPVAYADDLWVAGSYSKGLYYSTDGKTWTQSNITSGRFHTVAYADGLWVAGSYSTKGLYYSE